MKPKPARNGKSKKGCLRLPSFIASNMVLQRDSTVPLRGWAKPGETVAVDFGGSVSKAKAKADGAWRILLRTGGASFSPMDIRISSGAESIMLENVLVGEVWLCSGQSNMQFPLSQAANAKEEISNSNFAAIRFFISHNVFSLEPKDDVPGSWHSCSPATAGQHSGVAHFFARDLYARLNVPIGLIETSWGGTRIEAWTPLEALRGAPGMAPVTKMLEKAGIVDFERHVKDYAAKEAATPSKHLDPGNKGVRMGWAKPDFDDSGWELMDIPQFWESTGLDIDGSVWFRKDIEVPRRWKGKSLELHTGAIDDFDTTYFNGAKVGSTGTETPGWWTFQRNYKIPASLVRPGRKNAIAIRVFDEMGSGGLGGPAENMALVCPELGEETSLAGKWRYKVELALKPIVSERAIQPRDLPGALYNAMIHPFVGFPLKGGIWYQGESNAWMGKSYADLFNRMILSWRERWDSEFTFLFVQLANHEAGENWAELRESQCKALSLPKTGMAVAIDVGEALDIHPRNKQDVGARLALAARAVAYGEELNHSGPIYKSMATEGKAIRVLFDHVCGGLTCKGGDLKGFTVAGADRVFHAAEAKIDGDTVVVRSPKVAKPLAVRYAWRSNPDCNLCNKAGLPTSPFRSDSWPGTTK